LAAADSLLGENHCIQTSSEFNHSVSGSTVPFVVVLT